MQRVRGMTSVVNRVADQPCEIGVEPFTPQLPVRHLPPKAALIIRCTSTMLTTPSPVRSARMFGVVANAAFTAMSTSPSSTLPSPFRSHGFGVSVLGTASSFGFACSEGFLGRVQRVIGGVGLCCVGLGLLSGPGGADGWVVIGGTIGSTWVGDSRRRSASFRSFPSCRTSASTDPSLASDVPTVVRISLDRKSVV